MAMDTASKRSSAINLNSPWRGLWPIPDGAVSQGDRQATVFLYAGVLAGGIPFNPAWAEDHNVIFSGDIEDEN